MYYYNLPKYVQHNNPRSVADTDVGSLSIFSCVKPSECGVVLRWLLSTRVSNVVAAVLVALTLAVSGLSCAPGSIRSSKRVSSQHCGSKLLTPS